MRLHFLHLPPFYHAILHMPIKSYKLRMGLEPETILFNQWGMVSEIRVENKYLIGCHKIYIYIYTICRYLEPVNDLYVGGLFLGFFSKNQAELLKMIRSNEMCSVWLGTPCNPWSRARRNDGRGPGLLAGMMDDAGGFMGLPHLSEKDQQKVAVGNILMKFSARILRLCVELHIPVAFENPHTSRLWLTPQLRHLMSHKYCEWGYTDFCQDRTPWRKRT